MYQIWHPYSSARSLPPPCVKRAYGSLFEFMDGSTCIDAIGSWWTSVFGHSYPPLVRTLQKQASLLDHAVFASVTHEPAKQVALRLQKCIGPSKVMFSDNGSTAVETAMKLAYQIAALKGQGERTLFASFEGGYHGDTLGVMSLQGKGLFTEPYMAILKEGVHLPFVDTFHKDTSVQERERQALITIEEILDRQGSHIVAFVFEPLVQGSAGMRMCRPQFLQQVVRLIKQHGILCIADEVFTGLGRTGSFLACQKAGVEWDFLALAKGLTGGMLPLAVTCMKPHLFDVCIEHDATLFHGHTYTANPIACAVAADVLELLSTNPAIYEQFEKRYEKYESTLPRERTLGCIWAADLPVSFAYGSSESIRLRHLFQEKGVLARPLGSTLYFAPAYTISDDELATCFRAAFEIARIYT